jgi:preprotein translocase subunit SecG
MYTFLIVLAVFAAIFMVGLVLIQESKGGGLASQFDSYKHLIGVQKSTNIVERVTWALASIIVLICIMLAYAA